MGERLHGRMWLRNCLDTDMPILDHPAPSFTTSCPIRWKYTQAGVMKMSSTTSWSTCRSLAPSIRQSAGMLPCPKRYGIYFGDKFIQIYRWRIADHGGKYLSISYSNKRVVQLMGENGRVQNKGVDPVIMLGTGDGKPDRPRVFSLVITSARWAASAWVRFVVEERNTSPFHIRRRARRQSSTAVMAGTSMGHVLAGACKVGQCASVRSLLCERLLQVNASMSLPSYR